MSGIARPFRMISAMLCFLSSLSCSLFTLHRPLAASPAAGLPKPEKPEAGFPASVPFRQVVTALMFACAFSQVSAAA